MNPIVPFMISSLLFLLGAGEKSAGRIEWSATSTAAASVSVPAAGKPSIVAFVRPGQPQSQAVLEQIGSAAGESNAVQVIVVVSGNRDVEPSLSKAASDAGWPIVVDPDFAASGKFDVHVWPTTVVVTPGGEQAAHLAGLPASFASDLRDYVDFAAGKLDAESLKKNLADHQVVGSGDGKDRADRLLTIATRLIDGGQLEQADKQLAEALALRPDDPRLLLARARLLLLQDKASEALEIINGLPPGAAPPWQLGALRSRALISLERWDEAREILPNALKLNPNPAEAHYLLGLVHQHDAQWQRAAEEFRRAYESASKPGAAPPAR